VTPGQKTRDAMLAVQLKRDVDMKPTPWDELPQDYRDDWEDIARTAFQAFAGAPPKLVLTDTDRPKDVVVAVGPDGRAIDVIVKGVSIGDVIPADRGQLVMMPHRPPELSIFLIPDEIVVQPRDGKPEAM